MAEQTWDRRRMDEEFLHALYDLLLRVRAPHTLDGNFLEEVAGLAHGLTDILQDQALFRAEIESLRREVAILRREKSELEGRLKSREVKFQEDLAAVQADRDNWLRILLEEIHGKATPHPEPGKLFLSLPLVIRSRDQEYLGVAGRRTHFSLGSFIRLVEFNAGSGKALTTRYKKEAGGWALYVITLDQESGAKHEHVLQVRQILTPSGNAVAELTGMIVDGAAVPRDCLFALFRKIKK